MNLRRTIALWSRMVAVTTLAWEYFVNGFLYSVIPPFIFYIVGWTAFLLIGYELGNTLQEEEPEELPKAKLPQIIEEKIPNE